MNSSVRFGLWCVCLALIPGGLPATVMGQQMVKTIVENFRVPEYDSDGRLKSVIFGERAEMRADGKVKISNLRIELYREGAPDGTVWAAECVFDRKDRSAVSETLVRLERGKMVISGLGLIWNAGDQRIQILHDVRVVLRDIKVWFKQES